MEEGTEEKEKDRKIGIRKFKEGKYGKKTGKGKKRRKWKEARF